MTDEDTKHLYGAVKITRHADSIGLPIFTSPRSNAMYVLEMDCALNIVDFLQFHNRERFIIDRTVSAEWASRPYKSGDPSPLPYWHLGKCHIIRGDAEPAELTDVHGLDAVSTEVIRDLIGVLSKARSGYYRQEQENWLATDISATFQDVFHETPIHSRYWVGRFTQAVEHARKLAKPPHPVDNELRRVGLDWVKRFATKTDLGRLSSVVGTLIGNALSEKQAQSIFFAFFMHHINSGNFAKVEEPILTSNEFSVLFPYGLYSYYRENGWPDENFSYSKPFSILDPFYRELQIAEINGEFKRLERLSYAYFRTADAPREISDVIAPLIYNLRDSFMNIKREIAGDREYLEPEKTSVSKEELCQIYLAMMSLDGIIHGNARLSETIIDRRFGLDSYYVVDLLTNSTQFKKGRQRK